MGASDYQVGNAPGGASYSAPLVGFALGQQIADLPDAFMKGRQQARERAMQDAFKDGVPRDPVTGELDSKKIMDTGMRIGGLPFAQPLLQYMLDLEAGKAWSGAIPSEQGSVPPAPAGSAAGPGNITAGTQPTQPAARPQAAAQRQPQLSSAGTDNQGPQTINSLASEVFGEQDVGKLLPRYAAAVGNNLGEPLTPEQEQRARMMMQRTAASMGKTRVAASEDVTPPSGPTSAADVNMNGGSRSPFMGGSSPVGGPTSGAPAPVGGRAPNAVAQAGAGMATVDNAGTGPGGVPIRQTPVGTAEDARVAFTRASNMRKAALAMPSTNPGRQKALLDQAQAEQTRGENILKSLGEYNAPTNAEREAQNPAVAAMRLQEAQAKDDTTRYGKQLSSIQGSAQAANRMLQHIQMAEGIYRNPNFYSGAGEGLNLMYKRVVNALNPNNTEALPQEAFRKTMAASVLNQVEQLKDDTAAVGGGGRIFQAQIELMEKAANNPDNSIPANRLLTEIAKRGALESKRIAEMANKYKGGHLDAGFAQMVDDYYSQHPMFTPAEMQDIRLIAPPAAPKLDSREQAAAWARKAGLRPGDPMKLPSGRIVPAP